VRWNEWARQKLAEWHGDELFVSGVDNGGVGIHELGEYLAAGATG
jgi:hypothetical protein